MRAWAAPSGADAAGSSWRDALSPRQGSPALSSRVRPPAWHLAPDASAPSAGFAPAHSSRDASQRGQKGEVTVGSDVVLLLIAGSFVGSWRSRVRRSNVRRSSRVILGDGVGGSAFPGDYHVLLGEGLSANAAHKRDERRMRTQRLRSWLIKLSNEGQQPADVEVRWLRLELDFLTRLDALAGDSPIEVASKGSLQIKREEWDELVPGDDSMFLEHSFLSGLEDTECVTLAKGWQPRFLFIRERAGGRLVGAAPLYLKWHSDGEFVEEMDWIRAAYEFRTNPWPRLFVGVPFTPHRGSRLLVSRCLSADKQQAISRTLLQAMVMISERARLSVNVAFSEGTQEGKLFSRAGFVKRPALQAWWTNRQPKPYKDFDDFLGGLKKKTAKMIVNQRQQLATDDRLVIEVVDGVKNPEAVTPELMSEVYRHCYWPTQFSHGNISSDSPDLLTVMDGADLNEQFFQMLAKSFGHRVLLVLARLKDPIMEFEAGYLIGGSLCFAKGDRICGRYWGHPLKFPSVPHLHFECCYHALIEYAIEHGYSRVEPGNGGDGGVFKVQRARGFDPEPTPSYHYIPDADLRQEIHRLVDVEESSGPSSWVQGRYSAYSPAPQEFKGASRSKCSSAAQ